MRLSIGFLLPRHEKKSIGGGGRVFTILLAVVSTKSRATYTLMSEGSIEEEDPLLCFDDEFGLAIAPSTISEIRVFHWQKANMVGT
jgi:hypothetical protein